MTGSVASLGMRSGSYGSLAAAVVVGGSASSGRKAGGIAACDLSPARGEKERLQQLHHALRLVGHRRAGVLLLLAAASARAPIPPLGAFERFMSVQYTQPSSTALELRHTPQIAR